MNTFVRRFSATLAGSALAFGAVTAFSAPAQAAGGTDPSAARAAADWMLGNLGNDGLLPGWGGPDLGMTLDLGTALHAIGGYDAQVAAINTALEERAAAYTVDGTKGSAVAKALAFTADAGSDATANGIELLTALEDMVISTGASAGRIDDAPGGYDSTWTQIWAVKGLLAHDSADADAAVQYLADRQCADGSFQDSLPSDLDADQACGAETGGVDTTALAVSTLAPLSDGDPVLASLVEDASSWLTSLQNEDGSFDDPWMGANSNTTGLVGWALDAAGEDAAAARAAVWLRAQQVAGECAPALAGEAGAVAYTPEALAEATKTGIDEAGKSQWIFVGVQAIPGLAQAPAAAGARKVTGPAFVQAGKAATVTVSGVAPGERVCLSNGANRSVLTGTGAALKVRLTPAKNSTIVVTALGGQTRANTAVLGAKKLKPTVKKTVRRGAKQTVKVTGLAHGESVKVKLGAKKVGSAKANAKGVAKVSFKVTKKTKRGKATITVTGQFKNRVGSKKFTVK